MEMVKRNIKQGYKAGKRHSARIAKSKKARFGFIGVLNTIVDFSILNILVGIVGLPVGLANMGSTSVAMLFSFAMNRQFAFSGKGGNPRRQIILFFVGTAFGLWVIQWIVILGIQWILMPFVDVLPWGSFLVLNGAKLVASVVTLIWNYIWYNRVVFRPDAKTSAP